MFERPKAGERALLIHCHFRDDEDNEDINEFQALAVSAGALIIETVTTKRDVPDPKYFIGSGKAEEVKALVQAQDIELVLVNHDLSPTQERNLEHLLKVRVCDRTRLILDIFASRARTHEGQLQVELAQLSHLSTRLVRGWTHLERQKGGIGLRGPGETQLETDRRLLRNRVKALKERLEKVRKTRELSRKSRAKHGLFTISLVGYTNAGKSTLFNRLTAGEVYAADQLFATLDPTSRRIQLPGVGAVILIDTVGFIRHLPHQLVEAFRATLEETHNADLLLHVVDATDEHRHEKSAQVLAVLKEIDADELPMLEVFNKIDALKEPLDLLQKDDVGRITRIGLSAQTGEGIDQLAHAIATHIQSHIVQTQLTIPPNAGDVRAKLYAQSAVVSETHTEDGSWVLNICIRKPLLRQILAGSDVVCDKL